MKDIQYYRVMEWFKRNGDKTYRLKYDLNSSSIVVDAGGYHGDFSAAIAELYDPHIFIFEPIEEYGAILRRRFQSNRKIRIYPYALGDQDRDITLSLLSDGTSAHKSEGNHVSVTEVDTSRIFYSLGLQDIDLLKINIEGSEYDVIYNLINAKWIDHISNIQVQFHDFVADAEEKLARAHAALAHTHYPTYAFKFVWENWARRAPGSEDRVNEGMWLEFAELYEKFAELEKRYEDLLLQPR